VLVCKFVSQPSSAPLDGKTQLPKPAVQLDVQTALLQVGVTTFAPEHARLQAPQWFALSLRFSSQPVLAMPSQSSKPVLHAATMHWPALQLGVAFASTHGSLHAPQ
jgi:hypothetical protein